MAACPKRLDGLPQALWPRSAARSSPRGAALGITSRLLFPLCSNSSETPSRWRLPPWSFRHDLADLHLHHRAAGRPIRCLERRVVRRAELRTQHPVAIMVKVSIYRCPRRQTLPYEGPARTRRKGRKASRRQGSCRLRGQKTMRVDTMVVAVAGRLGVVRLSGMRWRATTLMPLDPHDHGAASKLRFRSAASGTALERALRVAKPSAVHPQCEAVECGG
jgi:hypothetical protein